MRAQQRRYDLWRAFILTMLPAVAGETLRDLLLGGDRYPPFIFKDPTYILIVISIVVVGTIFARFLPGEASHSPAFSRVLTVYLLRNRRKCASPNTIMWSRHSCRSVPISRSAYAFCVSKAVVAHLFALSYVPSRACDSLLTLLLVRTDYFAR
ncbi:MAG: TRIC cation channel family protein [Alphaproteobacteria bacterium]|nr:MAG: TRIC cation channel family protein [Alphaproteobacteria bacterium]